jgi:hypothetical protein
MSSARGTFGNTMKVNSQVHAAKGYWKEDPVEASKVGVAYLPVIYPGLAWSNLKGKNLAGTTIPRLSGDFFWRQFTTAANGGADMAYVAMFDEVDEATAIFKVTNAPPKQAHFETYQGLPSDWYLRLTAEGSKLIRGERQSRIGLPIQP